MPILERPISPAYMQEVERLDASGDIIRSLFEHHLDVPYRDEGEIERTFAREFPLPKNDDQSVRRPTMGTVLLAALIAGKRTQFRVEYFVRSGSVHVRRVIFFKN